MELILYVHLCCTQLLMISDHFIEPLNNGTIHKVPFTIQARIAQLVAFWLSTGEVPDSNPGKGENFSMKIFNFIFHLTFPLIIFIKSVNQINQ